MDAARQSRSDVRRQYENLLDGLHSNIEEYATKPRHYYILQSGIDEIHNIFPLSSNDNRLLNSITGIFANLLISGDNLIQIARNQFYDSISLYGEDAEHLLSKDGGIIEMMSNFLLHINEISKFILSCQQVAENLLLQIHGLFNMDKPELPNSKEFVLARMWRSLGEILSTFIVLDELIRSHPSLSEHWSLFMRSISLAQNNTALFDLANQSAGRLRQLNILIAQMDDKVIKGNILKNSCLQFSRFDQIIGSSSFMNRFRQTIFDMFNRWDRMCNSSEDAIPDKQRLLSILALSALYHHLIPQKQSPDKKMIRQLCASHKKICQFHLTSDILFVPFEFISKQIPNSEQAIDRKTISSVSELKKSQLDTQLELLNKDAQMFEDSFAEWQCKMADIENLSSSLSNNGHPKGEIAIEKSIIFLEGAQIADRANRRLKCILSCHLAEEKPLSRGNVRQIFQVIQIVKEISKIFKANWSTILELTSCACVRYSSHLLCHLESTIQKIKLPNLVATLRNTEFALSQPISRQTLITVGVSLELSNYTKTLRGNDVIIDEGLQRLDILCNFESVLARVTDFSYLYWHRKTLMQTFCDDLIQEPEPDVRNAINFFDALNDCSHLFTSAQHCGKKHLMQAFGDELFEVFKKNILDKICTEIENDLRLSFHSQQNAKLDKMEIPASQNPEKSMNQDVKIRTPRILHLLHLPKIRFGLILVDTNEFVVNYLESTFYNLSVIALHDCESYRQIRILARDRYGLHLTESNLPTRSVDQGLDVVTIMRDLEKFVDNYCYVLDEQFFIERCSQSKHLGIVRVQQIVNSMKTHGVGIINPLINFAYKYLRSQFRSLSQWLFDEKIKSMMIREIRLYRDSINQQMEQMYPVRQAEKMANFLKRYRAKIRGDSTTEFLNTFRLLMVRIGNIIGLVRMFRVGIVETCAPNILLGYQQKEPICNRDNMPSPHNQCAALCDHLAQNICSNLRENGDFIELMTSMFAKEFRTNDKFAHLRHFFILVPSLMLAHVEYILKSRNKFAGNSSRRTIEDETNKDFIFVDDGFSMGVAYMLTLLNQQFFFNSLNWFHSLISKIQTEVDDCLREQRDAQKRKDESLIRILAVKMSQLKENAAENRQIMCLFNSALTLLQANEIVGEDDFEETYLNDL